MSAKDGGNVFGSLTYRTFAMPVDQSLRRAGYWRRIIAVLIDALIIWLPFQALAAVFFSATSGWIQLDSGLTYDICAPAAVVPDALHPPPPSGSNSAELCRIFFLGAKTARTLKVSRVIKQGSVTSSVYRIYRLDVQQRPIEGLTIDWIGWTALAAYVIAMAWRTGATLGDRTVRIRMIATATPDALGVPLLRVIIRYFAAMIGLLPMICILAYLYFVGDVELIASARFLTFYTVAMILAIVWVVINLIKIVRESDPLYDLIAGTSIVRV